MPLGIDPALHLAISYLRRKKLRVVSSLVWRAVYEITPMQVPIFTGAIVSGLAGEPVSLYGVRFPDPQPGRVLFAGGLGLLFLAVVHGLSSYARWVSSAGLSLGFVADLRQRVGEKLLLLGADRHRHYGTGELLDRALLDAAQCREFTERVFVHAIANALRFVYPAVMIVVISPGLAPFALAILPPQWLLSRHLQQKLHGATQCSRERHSDLATEVQESLEGIETVQSLNSQGRIARKMGDLIRGVKGAEFGAVHYTAAISGTVWFSTALGLALTWWLGGHRVVAGEMTIGTLVTFCGFVAFVYMPAQRFTTIVDAYRRGLVSLERLRELLDTPIRPQEAAKAVPLRIREGRIEVRGVRLALSGQPILDRLDLAIRPGTLTAIVGRSGSGKSTLLRLLNRLYDPDAGEVAVDGQPLRGATLASVRSQIALVPQRPVLFSGTVLDNLRLARADATRAEAAAAADAAFAIDFIERLPAGFDTRLGRGGASLSGGEIQRLAIARALLLGPRILLLDEPTSALDSESEAAIVKSLARLRGSMTVVVVAHRMLAARKADDVILLEGGRVEGQGDYQLVIQPGGTGPG